MIIRLYSLNWFIRHLNGTVLESFVWPAFLITDAYNALNNLVYKRQRTKSFLVVPYCLLNFMSYLFYIVVFFSEFLTFCVSACWLCFGDKFIILNNSSQLFTYTAAT
ncbi:uncharacterized protein A4U43_C07F19670 [Asparagus officinalis]|uniref:Uncharacterized protein n=1 Tax=Asparagus officinalis TaxID=4686 RepID=A0A5P1EGA3_ASPOF|nr:uncharacterized protein A4U43_C07F19670 [Asparagus officinalis]